MVDAYKGKKLKGKRYQPLFTFLPPDKPAYYVVLEDYVTTEDGTGLVHTAPAFGAEDMQAALEFDLPVLMTVLDDGTFIPEVRPWSGKFVKDADPFIIEDLQARGLLFRAGTITHTYPFCWRCDTPLLYYARGTWYIRTSQYKDTPGGTQPDTSTGCPSTSRMGASATGWPTTSIGRWAASAIGAHPCRCGSARDCHHQLAVGSVAELSELAGRDLASLDLHRPYVDEVRFACPECKQGTMQRVPELIDVWFELGLHAGSPVALSLRKPGGFQAPVPRRLHLRGGGPDPRLVLLAACHQHHAVRHGMLSRTSSAWD